MLRPRSVNRRRAHIKKEDSLMKKTLASIEAEIEKLKASAEKIRKDEVAGVIGRIRVAIDHYGLTAADLGFGSAGAARQAKPVAGKKTATAATGFGIAKYRDPSSGKTWTGRGKPPAWIAGVANRDAFLIDGQGAAATPSPSKPATRTAKLSKASPSSKGGVPKYQDPASGKTWTGMGKPPGWIAGASDRSAFLIGSGNASSKAEAADTAPAEAKVGTKRAGKAKPAKPAAA